MIVIEVINIMNTLTIANELNKSIDVDSLILEYIEHSLVSGDSIHPLTEAIGLCPEILSYSVLIESVDEINNTKKEIEKAENEKDPEKKIKCIDKLTQALKNLFNWWYKIEPNKKYKTLRLVIKIIIEVIGFIILIYHPGKSLLTKGIAARLPIGYEGGSKILQTLIGKKVIAATITRTILNQIYKVLRKLNDKAELAANIEDLDKVIEEYDKAIDEINEMLENTGDPQIKMSLEKSKKELEQTLKYLIKLREKRDAEEAKKKDKSSDIEDNKKDE